MIAMPIGLMLLYVGLVVAPQGFGLPAALRRDWLAALTGILAGAAMAARTSEPDTNVAQTD
jgi:hypothetical protein